MLTYREVNAAQVCCEVINLCLNWDAFTQGAFPQGSDAALQNARCLFVLLGNPGDGRPIVATSGRSLTSTYLQELRNDLPWQTAILRAGSFEFETPDTSVLRRWIELIQKSEHDELPSQAASIDSARQLSPVPVRDAGEPHEFRSGEVVFFEDRVEICGVDVCSGPRSRSRRVVLELLSCKKDGTTFVAYSGEELEARAKAKGAKGTAGGWIRDLRDDIVEALRTQANIISGQSDVILSGGPGYRFAEGLTVRYDSLAAITDITDMAGLPDVRDDDVRDVFDVRDDEASRRREWIIQQLEAGVQLKAPMVASHFKRAKKTAQRDLDALRDEGKIEFVGDPRTGYYRLLAAK